MTMLRMLVGSSQDEEREETVEGLALGWIWGRRRTSSTIYSGVGIL